MRPLPPAWNWYEHDCGEADTDADDSGWRLSACIVMHGWWRWVVERKAGSSGESWNTAASGDAPSLAEAQHDAERAAERRVTVESAARAHDGREQ